MPAAQRMDCSVHVTPREAEVLDLLAMGFGDAEIGETMGLATRTVASERHPHPEARWRCFVSNVHGEEIVGVIIAISPVILSLLRARLSGLNRTTGRKALVATCQVARGSPSPRPMPTWPIGSTLVIRRVVESLSC
jgi:hypothetical protein